jgi:hypothetical protein
MRESKSVAKLLAKFYGGRSQFELVEHTDESLSIVRNGETISVWQPAEQDDCVRTFMRLIDAEVASSGSTDLLVLSRNTKVAAAKGAYPN